MSNNTHNEFTPISGSNVCPTNTNTDSKIFSKEIPDVSPDEKEQKKDHFEKVNPPQPPHDAFDESTALPHEDVPETIIEGI